MKRSEFQFELPDSLIAQHPLEQRGDSRLLCLDRQSGEYHDRRFHELEALLRPGDLLVFNNTRVVPARLFGHKESGGKVEILVERALDDQTMLCQLRASKSPRPGSGILLENQSRLEVLGKEGTFYRVSVPPEVSLPEILEKFGHVPLPPYIRREDEDLDRERYQTVFARHPGAVAAPTAGLHFDEALLQRLADKGVASAFVTLHVGAGTFQPVRSERIEEHSMHSEWFRLDEQVCEQVRETRNVGGRVIAVGTTVVRCLESATQNGNLHAYEGETAIFIYPGYKFQVVDGLVTNFHLPESTLLMLVCAFAGREPVLQAYEHAVNESYRFFSYGDAMFIS